MMYKFGVYFKQAITSIFEKIMTIYRNFIKKINFYIYKLRAHSNQSNQDALKEFFQAINDNNLETLKKLLSKKDITDSATISIVQALNIAVIRNYINIVELLLPLCDKTQISTHYLSQLLRLPFATNNLDMFNTLLKHQKFYHYFLIQCALIKDKKLFSEILKLSYSEMYSLPQGFLNIYRDNIKKALDLKDYTQANIKAICWAIEQNQQYAEALLSIPVIQKDLHLDDNKALKTALDFNDKDLIKSLLSFPEVKKLTLQQYHEGEFEMHKSSERLDTYNFLEDALNHPSTNTHLSKDCMDEPLVPNNTRATSNKSYSSFLSFLR